MGPPISDDGDVYVVTPVGASSLEIHRLDELVDGLVAGRRSPRGSHVKTKVERHVMVQWNLGGQHVTMYAWWEVGLSGIWWRRWQERRSLCGYLPSRLLGGSMEVTAFVACT
jgi:hypothetical protein